MKKTIQEKNVKGFSTYFSIGEWGKWFDVVFMKQGIIFRINIGWFVFALMYWDIEIVVGKLVNKLGEYMDADEKY